MSRRLSSELSIQFQKELRWPAKRGGNGVSRSGSRTGNAIASEQTHAGFVAETGLEFGAIGAGGGRADSVVLVLADRAVNLFDRFHRAIESDPVRARQQKRRFREQKRLG